MNIINQNLSHERQIFLWSVLGPLMALVTVLLTLYHQTPLTPYLSICLCVGIPVCWYLKKWGIFSFALILSYLLFSNPDFTAYQMVWHTGLALSVMVTLFLSTFGFDEALSLFDSLKDNNSADQKNSHMEIKYQTLDLYKKELENQKKNLIEELQSEKKKNESIAGELDTAKVFQEKYYSSTQEIDDLKNQIENAKIEIESLNKASFEFEENLEGQKHQDELILDELQEKRAEVLFLRDQLLEMQHELNQLPQATVIVENNEDLDLLKSHVEQKDQEIFNIQFKLQSALEDVQESQIQLVKQQDSELLQKKINQELSDHIDVLKREKELLETSIKSIQTEREGLLDIQVENQKLQTLLDEKEKEANAYTENLNLVVLHAEKIQLLSDQLTEKEKQLNTTISVYKQETGEKNRQLSDLQERLLEKDRQLASLQNSLKSTDAFVSKNEALQADIDEKVSEIDDLKANINDSQNEIIDLKELLKIKEEAVENEIVQLKNDFSLKLQASSDSYQEKLIEQELQLASLKNSLKAADTFVLKNESLEAEIQLKINEIGNLKTNIKDGQKEIIDLKELLKVKEEAVENEIVQLKNNFSIKLKESVDSYQERLLEKQITSDEQIIRVNNELSDKLKELDSLQDLLGDHQATHQQIKDDLEKRLLGTLKDFEKIKNDLDNQSIEKARLQDDYTKEIESLGKIIAEQTQEIQLSKQIVKADFEITESDEYKKENGLRRRAEGMYLQLKEQFNEKSKTLDETRKELFLTRENLQQLEKELEENNVYASDVQIENMSKYVVQLQNVLDRENQDLLKENEILNEMIFSLSNIRN